MTKPQPAKIKKPTRREKAEIKGRMSNFLMFLPNLVFLLGRLIRDARVPLAEKALFAGAIVYVLVPLDLIPDIFPFIGQVDDIYVVALTLLRLVNRTDERVVREHWSGGGDIVSLAGTIASLAPSLLPKRVSRVISSKVEIAPDADSALKMLKGRKGPVLIEIPAVEEPKKVTE